MPILIQTIVQIILSGVGIVALFLAIKALIEMGKATVGEKLPECDHDFTNWSIHDHYFQRHTCNKCGFTEQKIV